MRSWPLLAFALAGCALPLAEGPPRDLTYAAAELARAEASPFADTVGDELMDAEAALTEAERLSAARPGSLDADESAYTALRAAEKARVAARYQAAHEALLKARGATVRLRVAALHRDEIVAEARRRKEAEALARGALRLAHREALERAGVGTLLEHGDAILVRFASEELFLPGTSLLCDGAEARLAALAAALVAAPPCALRLQVLDDVEGYKALPPALAARRLLRVHDALRAHGVPAAAFLAPARIPPPGAQVDVLVMEPDG